MKITIEMAANGWLITTDTGFAEDRPDLYVYSHVDDFDDTDEVKAFAQVLWRVNDLIGPTTSRYSKARIYVEVKPGDKHEDYKDDNDTGD